MTPTSNKREQHKRGKQKTENDGWGPWLLICVSPTQALWGQIIKTSQLCHLVKRTKHTLTAIIELRLDQNIVRGIFEAPLRREGHIVYLLTFPTFILSV